GTIEALVARGSPKEVVHIVGPAEAGADPAEIAGAGVMGVHALMHSGLNPPARLWIVIPGGAAHIVRPLAKSGGSEPAQAALWGFGRVLANEYPDIEIRLVDVAPAFRASEAAVRIAAEIEAPN